MLCLVHFRLSPWIRDQNSLDKVHGFLPAHRVLIWEAGLNTPDLVPFHQLIIIILKEENESLEIVCGGFLLKC